MQEINSGNLNLIAKNVIAISEVFNIQSSNDGNDHIASLRENFISKLTESAISDISSVKLMSSALSTASGKIDQVSKNAAVILLIFLYYKFNLIFMI